MAENTSDPLYWDDAYPIALMLKRAHPRLEPTALSLDELWRWVIDLDGFADDPNARHIETLEAIQAEWVELE